MEDRRSRRSRPPSDRTTIQAKRVQVQGTVQGVGFRPFVYRLARRHSLCGWVLNAGEGVEIHVEGTPEALAAFAEELEASPPAAAHVARLETDPAETEGFDAFAIRESTRADRPTVRIAPDLPVCQDCLDELFDPSGRRHRYAYINCTNCGPRYSIIEGLPYDRPQTTMQPWPMCPDCARAYDDPADRRFHAQPVACPECGPQYYLREEGGEDVARAEESIEAAARRLREGQILAIKGLGGYHLACDARNEAVVQALRQRKFRKEKPFAVMAKDLGEARRLVELSDEAETLLTSTPRPIVLAPAKEAIPGLAPGIAPENADLGVMLPYTPLHHLLFDRGAPAALVMTSANRSSEPIAYRDADAFVRLVDLADAFLAGERPIARRVDDSVARAGPFGPTVLRRARGYAPRAVAHLPKEISNGRPLLAVGADLKNTVALVVDGQAFVSQHVGDLKHLPAQEAFRETIDDLLRMYLVNRENLLVAHDAHPQYASTRHAQELPGEKQAVQHHHAHVASVLAEREAWDKVVVGIAFDGTGYSDNDGDHESVWGGEVFVGSLAEGFERAAHLRQAALPGGDAAAKAPVQAAAGFLAQLGDTPDFTAPPFDFPDRYRQARKLVRSGVRTFPTTSVGRLFDTAAALLGFTREMTFEGQAAVWLEHQARAGPPVAPYPFPKLDFRPLLQAVIEDRLQGRPIAEIARAFHRGLAHGTVETGRRLCAAHGLDTLALSGGVFQNQLLLREIKALSSEAPGLTVWTNRRVPPGDGGISLGQAALAATADGAPDAR